MKESKGLSLGISFSCKAGYPLSKTLKKPIREIMKKYQLADKDKTFEVQVKVDLHADRRTD